MVSEGRVLLVDFDWAGKAEEVYYPTPLEQGITRQYCGGRDLEIVKQEHNLDLLKFYFSEAQNSCLIYGRRDGHG